jgi:small redox-active disulfide protein 2
MEIKILLTGCAKCAMTANLIKEAVKELNVPAEIEEIKDINKIISYGVMDTPALVVNGKVVFAGNTPSKDEIKEYISKAE